MYDITIIIPCFNERSFIERFIVDLSQQTVFERCEVLIADGCSTDGTPKLIEKLIADLSLKNVKLFENKLRIVSTGLNLAIKKASTEIIIRMDIHTSYACNYIESCETILKQNLEIKCVGGAWQADGSSRFQRSLCSVFMNNLLMGGAASRNPDYEGPVDTVYLGAWRTSDLIRIGGFDENLIRNQDDELCLRFRKNKELIWQSALIQSKYEVRENYTKLGKQFWQYGFWKTRVLFKHVDTGSPRQFAPFAFVMGIIASILTVPYFAVSKYILFGISLAYFLFVTYALNRKSCLSYSEFLRQLSISITIHLAYGIGFLFGIMLFYKKYKSVSYQISR